MNVYDVFWMSKPSDRFELYEYFLVRFCVFAVFRDNDSSLAVDNCGFTVYYYSLRPN